MKPVQIAQTELCVIDSGSPFSHESGCGIQPVGSIELEDFIFDTSCGAIASKIFDFDLPLLDFFLLRKTGDCRQHVEITLVCLFIDESCTAH